MYIYIKNVAKPSKKKGDKLMHQKKQCEYFKWMRQTCTSRHTIKFWKTKKIDKNMDKHDHA